MNSVCFIPYFPNNHIDETFGSFHLWNWYQYKDKYIEDKATHNFLDRYFAIYKRVRDKAEDRIAIINHTGTRSSTELPREIGRFADAAMFSYIVTISLNSTDA